MLRRKMGKHFCFVLGGRGGGGLRPPNPRFVWGFTLHIPHWGLRFQASNNFGLNPTSQLVIGYHWLAFLNQVRKNL